MNYENKYSIDSVFYIRKNAKKIEVNLQDIYLSFKIATFALFFENKLKIKYFQLNFQVSGIFRFLADTFAKWLSFYMTEYGTFWR